jgi:nucleotide-binding universal stress UspA family protein
MNRTKIVIGFDGSLAAQIALTWGLDEASRTGAPAEVVYADEWPIWAPAASMVPSPALRPDSYVDEVIGGMLNKAVATAQTTHPLVAVTTTTVQSLASTVLIERSAEARLIVLGGSGHSAVAGLFGSVASAVSAHARCPVVVARGEAEVSAPVVVGVDGSAMAPAVLRFAAEQAAGRKVALRVIRSWPPVKGLPEDSTLTVRTVTTHEREPFDTLVTVVRDEFPDLEIQAEAVLEHPAAALKRAGAGAQLLVVGSRGRGAVRGLLLGSVSQHLLRHAACSVAIVHDIGREPGGTS